MLFIQIVLHIQSSPLEHNGYVRDIFYNFTPVFE